MVLYAVSVCLSLLWSIVGAFDRSGVVRLFLGVSCTVSGCPVSARCMWLFGCLFDVVRRFLSVSVFRYRGGANCL